MMKQRKIDLDIILRKEQAFCGSDEELASYQCPRCGNNEYSIYREEDNAGHFVDYSMVCTKCGQIQKFDTQKGERVSPLECPKCGNNVYYVYENRTKDTLRTLLGYLLICKTCGHVMYIMD